LAQGCFIYVQTEILLSFLLFKRTIHEFLWRFIDGHTVYLATEIVNVNVCNIFLAIRLNKLFRPSCNAFVAFKHRCVKRSFNRRALRVCSTHNEMKKERFASFKGQILQAP